MQHRIGDLEALFDQSREDMRVLKALEGELRYRQVPKAVSLLADVQEALYAAKPSGSSRSAAVAKSPKAAPAGAGSASPIGGPPGPADSSMKQEAGYQAAIDLEQDWGAGLPGADLPAVEQTKEVPVGNVDASKPLTLEGAYKLLKALPDTPWEKVEQTRQHLVLQAHPNLLHKMSDEKRRGVLAQAQLANQAYALLANARIRRDVRGDE